MNVLVLSFLLNLEFHDSFGGISRSYIPRVHLIASSFAVSITFCSTRGGDEGIDSSWKSFNLDMNKG